MWIFTPAGFFSVVQKEGTNCLTIRTRVRRDLDRLRAEYLPELSETIANAGTDYPYRATVPHRDFAAAMSRMAQAIDYANFKDEVASRQGKGRAKVYGKIWQDLLALENDSGETPSDHGSKALSYGGIAFDDSGRVLLVEPKDHFDGYVWTFPKGRPKADETPRRAAAREFEEETGLTGSAVAEVPGRYAGRTTINQYFLMRTGPLIPIKANGEVPSETASVRWADYSQARALIRMTRNPVGMKRDLAVLDAAHLAWQRLRTDRQHRFEERVATTRSSWQVLPFDGPTTTLEVDWRYSDGEFDLIARGFLPRDMDDRWFMFMEDETLYACRSWTGHLHYRAPLIREARGEWRIRSIEIPARVLSENLPPVWWINLLDSLIRGHLLGQKAKPLGSFAISDEEDLREPRHLQD